MIRTPYPGGSYCDALPSGEFVVLYIGSHLQTHLGRVELPPNGETWIGFVRCTNIGGFRFAGQAQSLDPACWEWDDGQWVPFRPPCAGVSPVIYDHEGVLHRSDGSVGSQGYRYVDHAGRLWTGDETYRIDLGGGRSLFEYSEAGGLLIGQAAYDGGGVQVWDGSVLRQLELGDCRFVRVQWAGEAVSVAYVTPSSAVVVQTTLTELRALEPVIPPDEGGGGGGGEGGGGDGGSGGGEQESKMIYIDLRQSNLAAEKCEQIDNHNGTFSYKKVSNGKIFCVTPDGLIEERDAPGGPWESFQRTGTALIADRPWGDVHHAYLLPYVEGK